MRCYVLMGVSGCGKSSVGAGLAVMCGMEFIDGDDLHPHANIDKMSRGVALNDADRAPWLAKVGQTLASTSGPVLVGCSALKRKYRDQIRAEVPEPVQFIHLDAPQDFLRQRLTQRVGHFMPSSLLVSQFKTLEPLGQDEWGGEIDIMQPYTTVLAGAETYIQETMI